MAHFLYFMARTRSSLYNNYYRVISVRLFVTCSKTFLSILITYGLFHNLPNYMFCSSKFIKWRTNKRIFWHTKNPQLSLRLKWTHNCVFQCQSYQFFLVARASSNQICLRRHCHSNGTVGAYVISIHCACRFQSIVGLVWMFPLNVECIHSSGVRISFNILSSMTNAIYSIETVSG